MSNITLAQPGVVFPRTTGYLNYLCREDSECTDGLVCDGNLNLCKLPEGSECGNASYCTRGLYCNVVCINPSTAPDFVCPCDFDAQSCVNGVCKSLTTCSVDRDCATGQCSNGMCANTLANGTACSDNVQCTSGNCSEGLCQGVGVVTGQLGSSCDSDRQCGNGLVCVTGSCLPQSFG